MRIAILTTDMREDRRDYSREHPVMGFAPEALLQGFAGLTEVEVHVISCLKKPVISSHKIAPNITYHGLVVPKIGWMRTAYQGCIRAVRKKLREIDPDIVNGLGSERDCAMNAAFSGFPNVITIYGNMSALAQLHRARVGSYLWLAARLENFALRRTQGIICISDYVQDLVSKYEARKWLVACAIQRMFFEHPKKAKPALKPLLINVGVISERKRQQQVLLLLASLRDGGLDFDTLFVGHSASNSAYAVKFAHMLRTVNQRLGGFEYIPSMANAEFCDLYDRASAMVHFSSEESFGLIFAEAIARGLYLFASDVGAIREISQGVDRVQIFGAEAWEALKEAIRTWLVSGRCSEPRPENAPHNFVEKYHPVSAARTHVGIYREVMGMFG